MTNYYTGVGSRAAPNNILEEMQVIGKIMADKNFILRSGGAVGSDSAFEAGCMDSENDFREIFIPWNTYNGYERSLHNIIPNDGLDIRKAIAITKSVHPFWDVIDTPAKILHTRNVFQVLGKDLCSPSMCVICWSEVNDNPYSRGGTSTAIAIAERSDIPVFNLYLNEDRLKLNEIIEVI
jgi:predicted Rossmann-fold nucleotide-binding protein